MCLIFFSAKWWQIFFFESANKTTKKDWRSVFKWIQAVIEYLYWRHLQNTGWKIQRQAPYLLVALRCHLSEKRGEETGVLEQNPAHDPQVGGHNHWISLHTHTHRHRHGRGIYNYTRCQWHKAWTAINKNPEELMYCLPLPARMQQTVCVASWQNSPHRPQYLWRQLAAVAGTYGPRVWG